MLLQKDPHITQGDPANIDREILTSQRDRVITERSSHQRDPVII